MSALKSTSFKTRCNQIIKMFKMNDARSTPSLLMTIFGDSVAPHGGNIWLGSLISLVAPLDISQRLVRTSVYRLAKDDWVFASRVGRRSYYQLTASGMRSTVQAESRIYHPQVGNWDGEWRLVFTNTAGVSSEQRGQLRKRLTWMGFGVIAPNVYGHPTSSMQSVWDLLDSMGLSEAVVAMRARNFDAMHGPGAKEMAQQCWQLDTLESYYRAFVDRYRRVLKYAADAPSAPPQQCYLLRTLLIHDYRRVLLHDPQLPAELLPERWIGRVAYELCCELYRCVYQQSEIHLLDRFGCMNVPPAAAGDRYAERFGGLKRGS